MMIPQTSPAHPISSSLIARGILFTPPLFMLIWVLLFVQCRVMCGASWRWSRG